MTRNDVKWSKKNNNTFSSRAQQLVISNVNRVDTGTYVCSVVLKLTPSVGQSVNVTGSTTVEVDIICKYYTLIALRLDSDLILFGVVFVHNDILDLILHLS